MQRLAVLMVLIGALTVSTVFLTRGATTHESTDLAQAYATISSKTFVDLTHDFSPDIPHWKGFDRETVRTLYWYDPKPGTKGSGFFAQEFCHVGQWGTHVDPPAHFARGGRTVDQIDPKEMVMPLVVLDVHEKVARNRSLGLAQSSSCVTHDGLDAEFLLRRG